MTGANLISVDMAFVPNTWNNFGSLSKYVIYINFTNIILTKNNKDKTNIKINGCHKIMCVPKDDGNKQKIKRYNLISPVPIVLLYFLNSKCWTISKKRYNKIRIVKNT